MMQTVEQSADYQENYCTIRQLTQHEKDIWHLKLFAAEVTHIEKRDRLEAQIAETKGKDSHLVEKTVWRKRLQSCCSANQKQ